MYRRRVVFGMLESLFHRHSSSSSASQTTKTLRGDTIVTNKPASAKDLPFERGPVTWPVLAFTVAAGGYVIYRFEQDRSAKVASYEHQGKSIGRASLGGPFTLTAQDGRPFSDTDLHGQFSLLYFGFTLCPDICPDEMIKLTDAVRSLEQEGICVTPVFISVDPARDHLQAVGAYAHRFHPRLVALTSDSLETIKSVARKYRVYFNKTDDKDKDYLVDHSIITYLNDPKGEFVSFFGKNATTTDLVSSVKSTIEAYEKHHPEYDRRFIIHRTSDLTRAAEDAAYEHKRRASWFGWAWRKTTKHDEGKAGIPA